MPQVTRSIDPISAHNLLQCVPCACIAFASEQGVQVQPVQRIWRDNRYYIATRQAGLVKPY